MTQIGGDSQNTTPVAIQAGLNARQIVKAGADVAAEAAKQAPKLGVDTFKSIPFKEIPGRTMANMPLADALQQQSFFTRLAAKLPFVKKFLGADFILNEAIGGLGKNAVGSMSKAQITKVMLEGGDDIAKKLAQGGVPQETIELLTKKAAERAAALGGQAAQAATATVANAAAGMSDDAVKAVLSGAKNGGVLAGKNVSTQAIQEVLKQGGDDVVGALRGLGLRADAAKQIATKAAESGTKAAVTEGAQVATQTAAKEASKGGLKGFFGKLLGGAKGNFIVAGIFSLGSNAIQLATGKMNLKQFLGLTVLDTGAYGAIGMGSAAAGAAIGSVVPVAGTIVGFLAGLAIGMVGGMIYEKVLRNPVKSMLGPTGGGQQPYPGPGEYGDPYQQQQPQQPAYQDPYAQQQPAAPADPFWQSQTPAYQQPQQGAPADPGMSYDDALKYLNQ